MKRVIRIEQLIRELAAMLADMDSERVCDLYNQISKTTYAESYPDGIVTINDNIEQAS